MLAKLLLPPWERVLWKKQPYEDNYVDRTFLESLVKNANVRESDVVQIIKDSLAVAQHLPPPPPPPLFPVLTLPMSLL